jgi:hypothetical protein
MNSLKKCKQCGKEFTAYNSLQKVCSYQCSIAYEELHEIKKRFDKAKQAVKYDNAKKTLQDLINKIVRLLDRGHDCITSSKKYGTYNVHAGHFYSVGAHPELRYNLLNIYAQADFENTYKGGNGVIYSLRLKEVFGEDVANEIIDLPLKFKSLKIHHIEAFEACKKARKIIKALDSIEVPITTEMRFKREGLNISSRWVTKNNEHFKEYFYKKNVDFSNINFAEIKNKV